MKKKSDFKLANLYNSLYYQYKDSIDKLKKENELAQIAALDEQQRAERIRLEEQEAKEKKKSHPVHGYHHWYRRIVCFPGNDGMVQSICQHDQGDRVLFIPDIF